MRKADNKELEEMIEAYNELKRHKEIVANIDTNYFFEFAETLLKELKRLQEENKDLKYANREKADKLIEITDLYMRSIPEDKIREKIEELKDMKVDGEVFITAVNFAKKILKELLEEK